MTEELTVDVPATREHPTKRNAIHVDFFLVKMTEELTVDVPVVAIGVSPAVDKLGGTLLHGVASVKAPGPPGRPAQNDPGRHLRPGQLRGRDPRRRPAAAREGPPRDRPGRAGAAGPGAPRRGGRRTGPP